MAPSIIENKEAIKEQPLLKNKEVKNNAHASVREETSEQVGDLIGPELIELTVEGESKKVFEVIEENASKGSSSSTGTQQTQTKKQEIKKQIEAVKQLSRPQLIDGIEKELIKEIKHLEKQASKAHSLSHFSAFELNNIVRQIRTIQEKISQLVMLAIDKLRELYITLVLKLKLVAV